MGITPVVLAFIIGTSLGMTRRLCGGWVNTAIMRTIDVFYAFPSVLLAIALSGALGAGIVNALLSLTIVFVPQIARVAESVTAQVRKGRDYRRGGARLRRQRLHHRAGACAGQCARADLRLRHQPDRGER
jgi:ABC-type dipeptide/oligopeptide/nickel transport system permease subunit